LASQHSRLLPCLHTFPTRRSSDLLLRLGIEARLVLAELALERLVEDAVLRTHLRGRLAGHLPADPPGLDQGDLQPAVLEQPRTGDRKSTRLNFSHGSISYAVFCLK